MTATAKELSPAEKIQAAMDTLKITVSAVFVPWSKSRNAKPAPKLAYRSLNWRVTLLRDGREILTTDYSAGIAHCPSYEQGNLSIDHDHAVRAECESGRRSRSNWSGVRSDGKPIMPDFVSVVWSLCQDADVLDAGEFEEWASEFGYDTDSRKAEAIYRACLDIALKLHAAIGDEGLQLLRAAGEDY